MATLEINGRRVQVDDSFRSLSPDQQQAIVQQISSQMGATEKAGSSFGGGRAGAAALGAADTASFGFGDELGAALGAGSEYLASFITGQEPRSYDQLLREMRGQDTAAQGAYPGTYLAGQVAGGVGQGIGLARAGLSLGANAAARGANLGRVAGASAADGAIYGGIQGFGSGEGVESRLYNAGAGLIGGSVLGGAAPVAVAGAGAGFRTVAAPIMSRLRPEGYAERAIGETVRRSGMLIDDITNSLEAARLDGQDMFTVADALGNAGQRRLASVVRTPNDARQFVTETLQQRQVGQTERLSNALSEGFGAPDTAAQRIGSLTTARNTAADANYEAARQGAGVVDPSRAIGVADDFLQPGASRLLPPQTNIADDSVEAAVRKARGYLTDGTSVLSDFNAAFRSKLELDAMIERASPSVQRQLIPIRNALDGALEQASPNYATARNAFRQQSQVIDAVETGIAAASPRTRAPDNINGFNAMTPDEQAAFRAGYVDPYIARVENASLGPTTNRARMLITGKTDQEFPAFAAPGMGDQMGNRIAREQRMFETANASLGGSRTADNLADAADLNTFDPGIATTLFQGRPVAAAMQAIGRLITESQGISPGVAERIARALMETSPEAARDLLTASSGRAAASDASRAAIIGALLGTGSAGAGRLAAP